MHPSMLKQLLRNLTDHLKSMGHEVNVDNLADIVTTHAASAAVAAVASGCITGVGSLIAMGIGFGFVVAMYVRLAAAMHISMGKPMLKAVASAIVADITAYLTTVLVTAAAVSFIPFFGNMSSAVLTGIANFAFVYMAAVIFVKMLTSLLKRGINPATASEAELKSAAKAASASTDMKDVYAEAKQAYHTAKENGNLDHQSVNPDET